MALTDREIDTLHRVRHRRDMPAAEKREVWAGLTNHFLDPRAVNSMASQLGLGMENALETFGGLQEAQRSIATFNRYGKPETPQGRRSLYDDPLVAWTDVPGVVSRRDRVPVDVLRSMVVADPILGAIVQQLRASTLRHAKPVRGGVQAMLEGLEGFDVVRSDAQVGDKLSQADEDERQAVVDFLLNSGTAPRFTLDDNIETREDYERESLRNVFSHMTSQRFVLDAIALELERTLDGQDLSGMYIVDGGTIARTDRSRWPYGEVPEALGNPNARWVQVWRNQIVATFGANDLVYDYANPRDRIGTRGYGFSETEMSVRLTTGILNVMATNNALFDRAALPPGILLLMGHINTAQLNQFQSEWDQFRMGAGGQWGFPAMNLRDPSAKAQFLRTDGTPSDMTFFNYTNFLAAVRCAVFGMDVQQLNISAFGGSNSGLSSGKDHQSRVDESKNRSFFPWMDQLFDIFNGIVGAWWGGKWRVVPVGLVKQDPTELRGNFLKVSTVDETRASMFNMKPIGGLQGGALVANPSTSQMALATIKAGGATDLNGDGQIDTIKTSGGKT